MPDQPRLQLVRELGGGELRTRGAEGIHVQQVEPRLVDDAALLPQVRDQCLRRVAIQNPYLHEHPLPPGSLTGVGTGHVDGEIRCRYHCWTYGLDGALIDVPDREQFGDLDVTTCGLSPVHVDAWGGFVFVSLDPEPEP